MWWCPTLHAVKGLEYDKVYIMNVNEGSIPYRKAVLAEALEEERRLFYVGMTRAKKELMLCYVRRQYERERSIHIFWRKPDCRGNVRGIHSSSCKHGKYKV